jgi:hypothetical protein
LTKLAGYFDFAAVHLDKSLHQTQAQSQTLTAELELARGMAGNVEPGKKSLEEVPVMGGIDAHAGIMHRDFYITRRLSCGDSNLAAIRRELDGVQQVVVEAIPDLVGLDINRAEVRG